MKSHRVKRNKENTSSSPTAKGRAIELNNIKINKSKSGGRGKNLREAEMLSGARKVKLPAFYQPQLATLVDSVPQGNDWLHEIKFDGYRILCRVDEGSVSLLTREAHDWTARFAAVAGAAKALPVRQAFLDGEIVALKKDGTSDFQLLQNALKQQAAGHLAYFVFDLLYLDGHELTGFALLERKKILEKLFKDKGSKASSLLRFSEHWIAQGNALYDKACASGIEGIISKRSDQPYRAGRSRDWLKIKCLQRQEFVIGGFTDPAGSRAGLGALLLGVYDDQGSLHYAGRVGTGFTAGTLIDLRARLDKLIQKTPPFVNPPPRRQAKDVHWIKPQLVGEVAFTAWTQDNVLRHPSFKGLREDKPALQIRREKTLRLGE